jgi:hypothetical protein
MIEQVIWKSAGFHLLERNEEGWLSVTDDFLRAYYTRPEIHPIEESCEAEYALFEHLMATPMGDVDEAMINAIIDQDAQENYRLILRFRDHLLKHKTLEAAYMGYFKATSEDKPFMIPPMFLDQMVHLILQNILFGCDDPYLYRAGELFFRDQLATLAEDQLMLADQEIVEMNSENGGFGGLGQLLSEAGTPMREVSLDVMTEDNKSDYWQRADRFDMAVDFRFTQPLVDAFARVLERWVMHFLKIETRIQPRQSIKDERWSWHIGLDSSSSDILNRLYNGEDLADDVLVKILALFRLEFINPQDAIPSLQGKPVYFGLAMGEKNVVKLKPQNLLINLPIRKV